MLKEGPGLNKELVIALVVVFAIGISVGIYTSNAGFKEGVSVSTKLVAVDDSGNGVIADLVAHVKEGKGLVLVNVNNAVADIDTQQSARKAAKVAAKIVGVSPDSFDVSYDIRTKATKISGASAGTPMTIATIAALQNKSLKGDVAITGVVSEGGSISLVGSIPQKAQAAREAGMKILLVPPGSDIQSIEYRREKRCSTYDDKEFCEISYRDKISLGKYALELKEISTIKQALGYMLK